MITPKYFQLIVFISIIATSPISYAALEIERSTSKNFFGSIALSTNSIGISLVTWSESAQTTDNLREDAEVYGQVFDIDGNLEGSVFKLSSLASAFNPQAYLLMTEVSSLHGIHNPTKPHQHW